MPKMNETLTLQEILVAFGPAWKLANKTDDNGTFVMPDYRRALTEVWEDIVVAAAGKDRSPEAWSNLNVAMAKSGDH